MKNYFKIFFLTITLISLGTVAKCTNLGIGGSVVFVNKPHISHACSISSMKDNNPTQTHFLLLFRMGVDEKGLCFNYTPTQCEVIKDVPPIDELQLNQGLVKYVLTFYNFLALPPEFLSTAAFRSPPVIC